MHDTVSFGVEVIVVELLKTSSVRAQHHAGLVLRIWSVGILRGLLHASAASPLVILSEVLGGLSVSHSAGLIALHEAFVEALIGVAILVITITSILFVDVIFAHLDAISQCFDDLRNQLDLQLFRVCTVLLDVLPS